MVFQKPQIFCLLLVYWVTITMVTCYYFPSLLWQIPMDGRGAYYSVKKCRNVDQLSLRHDVMSFLLWSNMHMNTTAGQTSCQDKPSLVTPTLPPSPQMFPICPQISFHRFSLPCQNTCSYVWLHNTFGTNNTQTCSTSCQAKTWLLSSQQMPFHCFSLISTETILICICGYTHKT